MNTGISFCSLGDPYKPPLKTVCWAGGGGVDPRSLKDRSLAGIVFWKDKNNHHSLALTNGVHWQSL